MTIGAKIKYYRMIKGITQAELAELTGIHPVSIRKYETNKMQPQFPQIKRIATALGVSSAALNGLENSVLDLETTGDLMGLLMVLGESGIIQITGNGTADDMKIKLMRILSEYFELSTSNGTISLDDVSIKVKNSQILDGFATWDEVRNQLHKATIFSKVKDEEKIEELLERKTKLELELLSLNEQLG